MTPNIELSNTEPSKQGNLPKRSERKPHAQPPTSIPANIAAETTPVKHKCQPSAAIPDESEEQQCAEATGTSSIDT